MTSARRHLRRAAVATSLALAVAAAGGGALAAAPGSFAVGDVPSVAAGATPLGTLPSTTSLPLTVVLAPRDAAGMSAQATAVSTPGSPQFHHFLSVAQVAARFGATPASVSAVESMLRAQGLTPGALAPDRLSLAVSGTVAEASQAFGVTLRRYREASGRQVFANAAAARVPSALRGVVADVLGLDDLPAAVPASLVRDRGALRRTALAPAAGASANTAETLCPAATSRRGVGGPYTIDQIAGAYGMNGLYANGDLGSGVTIALFELEPYSATDLANFQSCLTPRPSGAVTNISVDGGPISGAGEETALDLDNVIGIAPASNVRVYQGPNTDAGNYATFAAIVNDNVAKVISDSWGVCEPSGSVDAFTAENTLFEQAAMQGQTILAAAGDSGSTACSTAKAPDPTIAVNDAASQPWVTGVGGTALASLGSPPTESVWNDGANDAGGGGISSVWAMPTWQKGLGINGQSSATPCASVHISDPTAGPYCREVPDVSADASPSTGYLIYFAGGWQQVGGTSAGAPLWAALTALADASDSGTCSPSAPLGFLNPTLYAIAAGSGAGNAFNDVTVGNNNPAGSGAYPAATGYDMATGLGTPIATAGASPGLVAQLCGLSAGGGGTPNVTLLSPADALPGTSVAISGSGFASGATVSFGSAPASGVAYLSANQLTATVPAGTGIVDVSVTAAGHTSSTSSADRFTYAPTESITAPASGALYPRGQQVAAAYSCAASTPGTPVCSAPVPPGSAIDTAAAGPHTFTVTATDANGTSTQQTVSYTVAAPPVATITVPAYAATYTRGQVVRAAYGCTAATPGIPACTGSVPSGSAVDTSTIGAHTFTVTAADGSGITSTATQAYTVIAAPLVRVFVPADGRVFTRGQLAHARFQCITQVPVVIERCTGTSALGATIATSALGSHGFTVTTTDSNGATTQKTIHYTVVSAQPTISALRQSAATWIERRSSHSRLPFGTRFSFTLDQPATLTFSFMRIVTGRLAGGRCAAATAATAGAKPCALHRAAGTLTISAHAGAGKLRFAGATGHGALAPGSYSVAVSAVGIAHLRSTVRTLRFVVSA